MRYDNKLRIFLQETVLRRMRRTGETFKQAVRAIHLPRHVSRLLHDSEFTARMDKIKREASLTRKELAPELEVTG